MNSSTWGLSTDADGHFVFGNIDLAGLAHEYGTPLRVVDEDRLRDNYRKFRVSFAPQVQSVRFFDSYCDTRGVGRCV